MHSAGAAESGYTSYTRAHPRLSRLDGTTGSKKCLERYEVANGAVELGRIWQLILWELIETAGDRAFVSQWYGHEWERTHL